MRGGKLKQRFRDAVAFLSRHRAEFLTGFALLVGWVLVVVGVAALTTRWALPIGLGLLLISLGGWDLLWTIIRKGLYVLTRTNEGK